jgi:hypothetical protein
MTLITDRFPDGGVQHDDDQHQVDRRTGVKVIKLFTAIQVRNNKIVCLFLSVPLQPSIMFVVRAMQEPTLEWSLALVASGLAHKHKTRL